MDIATEALLFDNDGTLINSLSVVLRCWRCWAEEYGVSMERFSRVQFHGRTDLELISELLPAEQVPGAQRRIRELELADTRDVVAMPGTLELLHSLPEDRWAVVTSANRVLAEARLAVAGIAAPLLISSNDVRHGKPDPEPFLLAAEKLGVAPAGCVVVEDAPAGIAAAKAAGMRSIAVATTHQRAELVGLPAEAVLDGLHQVRATANGAGVTLSIDAG